MPTITPKLAGLKTLTERLVETLVAPRAAEIDAQCQWPREAMNAFGEAGLLGLHVPLQHGGQGQGLLALSVLTETIARACPSSAMCFGMHCVATAVIAAKATRHQQNHYLREIAAGRHVTSLALSEAGSGAHFYLPQTSLIEAGDSYRLNGTKQFITSGGQADSYVVSTRARDDGASGDFSCVILDRDSEGMQWLDPWQGFGMRGNSSRGLRLDDVKVPRANLLGEPGDQVWYVFEVVAPYFLMAMAGAYLGIAQAALDAAGEQLRMRQYAHSSESLRDVETLRVRYAEMWISLEKTRGLVREAAYLGDSGSPDALPFILASKADAGETAVELSNQAMTLCGGAAYRANSRVAQLLRDARASHVMAPTTDMLKSWIGRHLLGLPLL